MDLDRIDFEILRSLRNNARVSNKELAERLDIAPSTCLGRVRRLTGMGAITGFHADIDPRAMGVGLQAMISVRLSRHAQAEVAAFRAHVMQLPEAIQLYHVAGRNDFLIHVWAKDSEHLRDLAITAFTAREEVAQIETGLIFEHGQNPSLPCFVEMGTDYDR